jgi:hypothetical protein
LTAATAFFPPWIVSLGPDFVLNIFTLGKLHRDVLIGEKLSATNVNTLCSGCGSIIVLHSIKTLAHNKEPGAVLADIIVWPMQKSLSAARRHKFDEVVSLHGLHARLACVLHVSDFE